jgi:hypothetical protein
MKKTIFILLLLKSGMTIAQSKKEQIEILKFKLDSINTTLLTERETHNQNTLKLNSRISSLEGQNNSLSSSLLTERETFNQNTLKLNSRISNLEGQNNSLSSSLNISKDSLSVKENEYRNLVYELNIKNDELSLLRIKIDSLIISLSKTNVDYTHSAIINANTTETIDTTPVLNLPKIDDEKELIVKLASVVHGDMSTYLEFEVVNAKDSIKEIIFAYWNWKPESGGVNTDMESYDESNIGNLYKIKIKYTKLESLEYKGYEIGNVKTGEFYNDWVLIKIQDAGITKSKRAPKKYKTH